MRCRFLGAGGKNFGADRAGGLIFGADIQDQDHSHRAGIRPRNTSRGPRADKQGFGADIGQSESRNGVTIQ